MTKAELVRRIEKAEAMARGAGHDWFGLLSERDALKERLEKCEAALRIYADEKHWRHTRRDGPVDEWICCDKRAWNGPDAARAALEAR